MAFHCTDFHETLHHLIIFVVMCCTGFCSPERMHNAGHTPFASPAVSDTVLVRMYVCMYVCMSYPECHPNRPGSMEVTCGNKMPTRCNRGFYCRSYCLLNKFRAPLCPSSGAQEYYTVVAACGISCCGFQVAGLVCS